MYTKHKVNQADIDNYMLSKNQLIELNQCCEYASLDFHSMAARPAVAKQLISDVNYQIALKQGPVLMGRLRAV